MDLYWDIAWRIIGSVLGTSIGLGLVGGVIYLQYREYQNWQHPAMSYWLLKLGAPIGFGLLVLVAVGIANLVEGMEALGVFYAGLFGALLVAPVAIAALGTALGIPFRQAVGVTASITVALLGIVYGGSMAMHAGGELFRLDVGYEKEKRAQQQAEAHPDPAGDAVSLLNQQVLGLPDGRRLLVLAIVIEPGLRAHKLQIKTPRSDREAHYQALNGFCFADNTLHVFGIVDQSDSVDFRFLWRRGEAEKFVLYQQHFDLPIGQQDRYLEVFVHSGRYDLLMPLPIHQAYIVRNDAITRFDELFPWHRPDTVSPLFEGRICSAKSFSIAPFDYLNASFYSDELGQFLSYKLLPRHVAPEFRKVLSLQAL